MLSETIYVSLVNFPSIQIVFLSVSLVTDQGFIARLASECSVDAQFFFKKNEHLTFEPLALGIEVV